jgi:hypothetical protein
MLSLGKGYMAQSSNERFTSIPMRRDENRVRIIHISREELPNRLFPNNISNLKKILYIQALARISHPPLIPTLRRPRQPRIPTHVLDLLILRPLIRMSVLAQAGENTTLLRNTGTLRGKGRRRQPVHGFGRQLDLVVQLVDLLERESLGLVDHEVHKGDAQEAAAEPDEEDLGLQVRVARAVVHEVGG